MQTAIIEELDIEAYHQRSELSSSQIRQLLNNPYELAVKLPQEDTPAKRLGSAIHTMVLEPHLYSSQFAVEPVADGRTTAGKAVKADFALASQGKRILTAEQGTILYGVVNAIRDSRIAGFFEGGRAETSVVGFVTDDQGKKYPARCRMDYWSGNTIFDLKTTTDASPDGFTSAIGKYGYYIQTAFYIDVCKSVGIDISRFAFVAVETKEPFMIGVYNIDPVWLDFGRAEYKRALSIYDRLEDYREPIYRDTLDGSYIQTLSAPNYLFYKRNASI